MRCLSPPRYGSGCCPKCCPKPVRGRRTLSGSSLSQNGRSDGDDEGDEGDGDGDGDGGGDSAMVRAMDPLTCLCVCVCVRLGVCVCVRVCVCVWCGNTKTMSDCPAIYGQLDSRQLFGSMAGSS